MINNFDEKSFDKKSANSMVLRNSWQFSIQIHSSAIQINIQVNWSNCAHNFCFCSINFDWLINLISISLLMFDGLTLMEWSHSGGVEEVHWESPDDGGPCWLCHRCPRLLVAAEAESVEAHVLEAGVGHEQGLQGDEPWGGPVGLTSPSHLEINWAPAPNVTQEIPRNPSTQHSATSSIMLARRVMKQP